MRLEKRKELKEYTWKAMRSSAIEELAAQEGSVTRVIEGSGAGYQARPRKSAKVNKEFTLTIPSKAIMWVFVVSIRVALDNCGRMVAAAVDETEKTREMERTEKAFLAIIGITRSFVWQRKQWRGAGNVHVRKFGIREWPLACLSRHGNRSTAENRGQIIQYGFFPLNTNSLNTFYI